MLITINELNEFLVVFLRKVWCPKLKIVLAKEEILAKNGLMVSECSEYPVIKKKWNNEF